MVSVPAADRLLPFSPLGPTVTEDTPLVQAVAGVVTAVTLTVAFGGLAVGWPLFWVDFPVGFGGVLPAAVAVTRWYQTENADASDGRPTGVRADSDRADSDRTDSDRTDESDPTAELRDRYVAGEIDEVEFERRLEELLDDSNGVSDAGRAGDTDRASDADRTGDTERVGDTDRTSDSHTDRERATE